jgi:mannan endo-1,4-beta-mannosidase
MAPPVLVLPLMPPPLAPALPPAAVTRPPDPGPAPPELAPPVELSPEDGVSDALQDKAKPTIALKGSKRTKLGLAQPIAVVQFICPPTGVASERYAKGKVAPFRAICGRRCSSVKAVPGSELISIMPIRLDSSVLVWLAAIGCGTSAADDDGGCGPGRSDCATGGSTSSTGGTQVGTGGASAPGSGGTHSSGGRGGTANASAGTSGAANGGSSAGGAANGGSSAAGAANGGSSAAGAANGGSSAGGAANGGSGAAGGGGSVGTGGAGGSTPSGCDATGFHVRDGALYDVRCNEFVMRGVNYPYTWFATRSTQQDLAAIAATGANAVRLVLSTGGRWTKTTAGELTSLISSAKAARLVSILEVHDSTGYSEQAGSVALSDAVSYWTSSDVVAALEGQEAYVIINVANEPNGNDTSSSWAPGHVTAVQALRNAGLGHTLMVDAPNWGQDWQNTMRDGGGSPIWDADTEKNLVFSVHMYDVYGASSTITNYFNTFLSKYAAPLVVGEFASDHGASGDVDEATIMALSQNLSIGYLGWSWAGNSTDLASLDITNNFDSASLTTWGTRLINGTDGISSTSESCTCFD